MKTMVQLYKEFKSALAQLDASFESVRKNRLSFLKTDLEAKEKTLSGMLGSRGDRMQKMKLKDSIEYLRLQIIGCEEKIKRANIVANATLKEMNVLCKEVRKEQPQLAECGVEGFGKAERSCEMLAFGRIRLCYNEERIGYLPRLVPFPLKSALSFGLSTRSKEWIADFILRIFQCIPLPQISITAIDPVALGKSLPDFQVLLRNRTPFPDQRILTRGDEIEKALSALLSHVEHLSQKVFVSGISDWADYNRKNPKNPLPYKLLIAFDIPEQLSEKSALYLSRLLEHGPRCGVLPLLSYDKAKFDERKHAGLIEALSKHTWENREIYRHSSMTALWRNLQFTEEPELPVPEEQLRKILDGLEEKFRVAGRFAGKMEDLWITTPMWSQSAGKGLEAEVGWSSEGNMPVYFRLGDNPAHALLGGSTGSGKSNFLHILIHSLCHRYSPDELNLYLLDYKEGVEFNCYTDPVLPHARLVAIESDIEYGIAVLRHLCDEHHRRSALFKKSGLSDYQSYRNQGFGMLPRIVVIIDEFQRLFEGGRTNAEGADALIKTLLKQARSSGIHLILATQTVRGLQNQSVGELLSNLGCRMALSCPAEDSAILLGSGNTEAETLQKQRDGIINFENGVKSANVKFCIPYADKTVRSQKLSLYAAKGNQIICQHTIFRGNALPTIPSEIEFTNVSLEPGVKLLLGEVHDFDAKPFIVDVTHSGIIIAGFEQSVRNGIICSIVASLHNRQDAKVVYYSSKENKSIALSSLPANSVVKNINWDFSDLGALVNGNPNVFLIIDTYDYARQIAPSALGSYRRQGAPETPWDVLKRIADPLSLVHARVFLFVENYHRFASPAKDLFNLFDLRIGFGLDEDDAGSFASSGSISKLKGLQSLTKAVFVDRTKGGVPQFVRPFVCRSSEENEVVRDVIEEVGNG